MKQTSRAGFALVVVIASYMSVRTVLHPASAVGDQRPAIVTLQPEARHSDPTPDGSLQTEDDAKKAALAEVSDDVAPDRVVARLITAIDVGRWLGSCMSWQTERPFWVVAIESHSTPDWFGMGHEYAKDANLVGTYVVLDARDGQLAAFGGLQDAQFQEINNMSSRKLRVAFETPLPAITGVPIDVEGKSAVQIVATIQAAPTQEARCRSVHW